MAERSSSDWQRVLSGLAADVEKAEGSLASIAAERRPLALAAVTGDLAAAEAVDRLNRSEGELRGRIATLKDAAEDAESRRINALAAEEEVRAAARLALRREAAARHDELSATVDAAARALAEALTAHGAHVSQMAGLGLEAAMVNRLRNRTMLAGALHLAGLGGADIGLRPCGPSFRESAQAWSRRMLANLLPPDRQPAPRPAAEMPEVLTPGEIAEMAAVAEVEDAA